MKNTIIHFINDFHSNFYEELFKNFKNESINHLIFSTTTEKQVTARKGFNNPRIRIIHRYYPSRYLKIFILFKVVKEIFQLRDSKIILHPNSAYIEGAIVLFLKLIFRVKIITTLRNSDVNFYEVNKIKKYLYFQCIKYSEVIILKSPSFRNKIPDRERRKVKIIPNGIDAFWLKPIQMMAKKTTEIKLITVGDFYCNKNIHLVIDTCKKLRSMGHPISLIIAGRKIGDCCEKITSLIEENYDFIEYAGFVDKTELKRLYQKSDLFIMASTYETFGLVYLEAMSQGLPIIFTKNQGVDGLISDKYSMGIDPTLESIEASLLSYIKGETLFEIPNVSILSDFDWVRIAESLETLYAEI